MKRSNCKICDTELVSSENFTDKYFFNCANCGKYFLIDSLSMDIDLFDDRKKDFYKVSSYINEQNNQFKKQPEIDYDKLKVILNMKDKKIKEKFDLMMIYLSNIKESRLLNKQILVKCWMKDTNELELLINKAITQNLIEAELDKSFGGYRYPVLKHLTFDGIEYIEELEERNKDSMNIFVAFNFKDELIEVFENQVKEAIEETGFTYTIVNQETTAHDQKISDEIVAKIKSSRMIIADFTNNSTNVYFEAGLAMGLRIPVIWTCKKGHEFSFDTGQFPHITWETPENLKVQIINRIKAII